MSALVILFVQWITKEEGESLLPMFSYKTQPIVQKTSTLLKTKDKKRDVSLLVNGVIIPEEGRTFGEWLILDTLWRGGEIEIRVVSEGMKGLSDETPFSIRSSGKTPEIFQEKIDDRLHYYIINELGQKEYFSLDERCARDT